MPGSHGDRGRRPFAPGPQILCCLLQRAPNAPLVRQGRADSSTDPTARSRRRETDPRWAASPVLPDVILGRDTDGIAFNAAINDILMYADAEGRRPTRVPLGVL